MLKSLVSFLENSHPLVPLIIWVLCTVVWAWYGEWMLMVVSAFFAGIAVGGMDY